MLTRSKEQTKSTNTNYMNIFPNCLFSINIFTHFALSKQIFYDNLFYVYYYSILI